VQLFTARYFATFISQQSCIDAEGIKFYLFDIIIIIIITTAYKFYCNMNVKILTPYNLIQNSILKDSRH